MATNNTVIDMRAETRNIFMMQGSSLVIPFTVTREYEPISLVGWTLRAQFRKSYADTDVVINCTNANSKLVVTDAGAGKFKLVLVPADTSYAGNPKVKFDKESPEELELVYDVEMEDPAGNVYKVCNGALTITRESTR